jgi:hypothetical protein
MQHSNEEKGITVKTTEHTANPASTPRIGLFALLAAFHHLNGTGAPKIGQGTTTPKAGRSLILSVLATTLGVFAFTAAPALAAAPEAPHTEAVTANTGTSITFNGTLNPGVAPQAGTYEFLYKKVSSGAGCESESATPAGVMSGLPTQPVSEPTGVEPNTEYTVCLAATNPTPETTVGNALLFKTKALAPTISGESTSGVNSSSATLEANVNPNNEKTSAHLQYSTSATVNGSGALTTPTALASSELGEGYGGQPVGSGGLTGLPAGATFYYQAVATNTTGTTYGAVQSFTTVPTPATAAVSAITATTATFNGSLTPLSSAVATEYSFDYRAGTAPGTECAGESATASESAGTGSGTKAVSNGATGLSPNTKYSVCLVSSNAFGSQQASPVTFTTLIAAPTIETGSESSSEVTSSEARLAATIASGNAPTSYHFEYGTSEAYEHSTPSQQTPAKLTSASVSAVATGLEPGTIYHYRAVASNATGTEYGPDQTFTTSAAAPSPGTPGSCANEKLREEQPYGLTLPDCRAYEMVSPPDTNGQDATTFDLVEGARASEAKELEPAITYPSRGSFANPTGALVENQLLSRLTRAGWTTQSITPLSTGERQNPVGAYLSTDFTPELTAGLTASITPLVKGAPEEPGLYVAQFAAPGYEYVGQVGAGADQAWGASSDLSRVAFIDGEKGSENTVEWMGGTVVPVGVTNTGEEVSASAGSAEVEIPLAINRDVWQAVSSDGERVYFSSPGNELGNIFPGNRYVVPHQLYVRVNVGAPQSPLADGEADGTGTLTKGSDTVASLITATGEASGEEPAEGATELKGVTTRSGRFAVGAEISASSIAPGTTITAVSGGTITLSKPTTATTSKDALIESKGPEPFVVGQRITGNGIRPGTTITAVGFGKLTLSGPAGASGTAVALTGGGECAVAADACTVDVSASQRFLRANPAGVRSARYWGASADGSRVFFTSGAELTEDAYTGTGIKQELAVETELAGKTFTLSFKGQTTGEIPYEAAPAEVQAALEALSSIGAGNVSVGAGAGGASTYLITFEGVFTGTEPPLISPEGSAGGQAAISVLRAANLYEYDLETGKLTDLTGEGTDSTGEGAAVQGVVQISEEGQYVYFVAKGALKGAGGATLRNSMGEEPVGEGDNLYVSHEGGEPVFIATLPANDISDWGNGSQQTPVNASPVSNTAVVTPNGARLAFLSNVGLPTAEFPGGYDSEQAGTGECEGEIVKRKGEAEGGMCTEVYVYDAEAGRLVCASCDPGARPVGPSTLSTPSASEKHYRPRDLLEDGTLFFESKDALVPGAGAGRRNVYEYENGVVHAISDVSGGYESYFLDASPNGENVFFASADKLLPEDPGGNTVVWDARVDGGFPVAAPACTTAEACRNASPPTPYVFGPPPSATFSGPGNIAPPPPAVVKPKPKSLTRAQKLAKALKQCAKDKQKAKRAKCQKQAKQKFGAKKSAKKATTNRRVK